jgi:hypothetical protein
MRVMAAGVFLVGLAATLALALAIWNEIGGVNYNGGDGKLYQTLVLNVLRFSAPFDANVLNPLQGMFTQQIPTNAWLNPAYAVFRVVDFNTGLTLSAAIAFAALASAGYLLARACHVRPAAAVAGALASLVAFAPFCSVLGLNSQYSLVPATAFTLAVETLVLVVIVCAGRLALSSLLLWSITLAAILAYAMVCDPMYFVAGVLSLAPCGAVLYFADATRERLLARLIVLVAASVLVFLSGLLDYLHAFVGYTARYLFPGEVPRHALPGLASSLLAHPAPAGRFFLFMMLGAALGLMVARGRVRLLLLAVMVQWLVVLACAAIYLFSGIGWILPLPIYLEQGAYHLYALAGVVGWSVVLAKIIRWRQGAVGPAPGSATAAVAGVLAVPLVLLIYLIDVAPHVRRLYVEPWPEQPELLQAVAPSIDLPSNGRFRGSVAVSQDYSYSAMLRTIDLWRHGLPTLNEYSQLVTPPMFHLTTRLLTRNPALSVMNGFFIADASKIPVMTLMGARYLLTVTADSLEGVSPTVVVDGALPNATHVWYLRELPDPNVGQYSPTDLVRARTAARAVRLMDGGMDFRRQVVVSETENLPPLASATHGEFSYRDGRIRVSARASGHALIVLPVQYSHCLRIVDPPRGARLIRANLALTGVLFERSAEFDVAFDFGFLSARCRWADLADLDALELKSSTSVDTHDRAELMPYAIDGVDSIGPKLRLLWQNVQLAAATDRQALHLVCGPICQSPASLLTRLDSLFTYLRSLLTRVVKGLSQ